MTVELPRAGRSSSPRPGLGGIDRRVERIWKRLTDSSHRDYECCLDKLARHFLDLRIEDFEPPKGTEHLEELLDALWGDGVPRT